MIFSIRHKYLIAVLGLFTGWSFLSAQHPQLQFKHLSVEDGLSQSTVRAIFQDKRGFMWFGTDIGINKFDGSEFVVYKYNAADTLGISSNFIIDIFEDSYGHLWIGTGYGGLCTLDREQETFHNYLHQPGNDKSIGNNNIRAIFEDSRKNLWIGTAGGGLARYNQTDDSFTNFRHDSLNKNDIGSNFISDIDEDNEGNLWLASPEGLLICFNPLTGKFIRYDLFSNNVTDRYTTTFGHVYADDEDNIWVCSESGLYLFNQHKGKLEHFVKGNSDKFLNENAVSDILEFKKGIYFIATDHGGLNIYNRNTGKFSYYMHSPYDLSSLSNDQLYNIYRSPDGIIWIGNYHGGINIYDPKSSKFSGPDNLALSEGSNFDFGSVLSICEDYDKNIWFGYDGQGIDVYNRFTRSVKHIKAQPGNPNTISTNNIVELYKDRNGDMWIGTYLAGMSKYERKTGRYIHYKYDIKNPDGLGGNNVWAIFEDSKGYMWFGLQGNGVDRMDPKTGKFRHYTYDEHNPHSLPNNDTYKIFEDKDGNIWISTRKGLCLYNSSSDDFTKYTSGANPTGIFGNCVYDIYQDHEGNLWIGTDQALNLFLPATKTFAHFQESEGLIGNAVLSITEDNKNNLWLSTNKGLSRFGISDHIFRNYDVADGLQSNEFNYVSVMKGSDGKIYFGGKTSFSYFNPDSIFDNPLKPAVYFTRLTVGNELIGPRMHTSILSKHITFEKSITLDYDQDVITIGFSALNYSNSQKNQYKYMLVNFDKDWNGIGSKHEVTYTNLNPGKYTLKVMGSNNDGLWNEQATTLQIIVLPPWWKTLWFRIFMYVFLAGILLLIYYVRLAFYQNQQKKLLVLVKERTFQLEEVAVALEEKQEEINSQNEELMTQRDELENNNRILTEQKAMILSQNKELDKHRNQLESLVEDRTRELIEAKNKAEESDRLKSSFLANLSHEIRTPLNAILGFSSLLGEKNITNEEREEYNRIIQGSSNTLLDLISDILDISKIEAGQLELAMQEVSLEEVINDLVDIFDLFIKRDDIGSNKPVQLKVAIEDEIRKTQIITDNLRLTQVLSNLINNAIKFTHKGYIEVGCVRVPDAEMLEFYVKDTGIGIKEENQELVFERFRKVEEDKNQLHRGTGLGLAISCQLVNLMGGKMRLTSKFGEGSTFYFTIPLIKAGSVYTPTKKKVVADAIPNYGNAVVLVAEDDISNFNYIEKLLTKAKAKVIHAENGHEVVNMIQRHPEVRIVLMDIKMPVMDGIEALHAIHNLGIKVPVVAQTAYALADEIVKLKKEGFDEYISKPIQRENLYCILSNYLLPHA